jgi:hypothetical protein
MTQIGLDYSMRKNNISLSGDCRIVILASAVWRFFECTRLQFEADIRV